MEPLKIYLLGEFRVYRSGERVDLPTKPIKSLFAYLLTHRQRGFPPELLAGTLWGERSEERARASLHNALRAIRRALPGSIITEYGDIQFNPALECWLDIEKFERKLQESRGLKRPEEELGCLRSAVELYQGDFLEGFYDDWALAEQERLRELYLEALKEQAACHKALKEYDRAIGCCKRILERAPLREEVHRELIYLYYLSGDRNAALLQYEECCKLLKKGLGIEPLPETRALFEEIREQAELESLKLLSDRLARARLLLARYPELGTPFVGRDRELGELLNYWRLAEGGRGGVVFIEGEAGIGKSRLARELFNCIEAGSLTLTARCYRMEQGLPFAPLIEALRRALPAIESDRLRKVPRVWLAEVLCLLPELGETLPEVSPNLSLPPEQERARLFEGLNRFIFALSQDNPLLLLIDDLHWADDSTLQYLHYLARHISRERVLLLCAYRAEEVDEALRALISQLGHEGSIAKLALGSLAKREVRELIAGMLKVERGIDELVSIIYEETEGNPFFAVEMVKALIGGGGLYLDERGRWQVAIGDIEDYIPADVQELIRSGLRRVSSRGRQVLDLAAVIGRESDLNTLELSSGWREDGLLEALDELLRAHLLVEEDGRFSFAHELVWQVVYKALSTARRRSLHLRAGEALEMVHKEQTYEVAAELAHHFCQAEQWQRALDYLIAAGERAKEAYANREALKFFREAERLAEAMESKGYEQSRLWEKRFDLLAMRCSIYTTIYDILEAKSHLTKDVEAMVDLAGRLGDRLRLAQARKTRAEIWFALGRHQEALEETRQALEIMRELRERRGEGEALTNLGAFHVQSGECMRGLEYFRQASQLYEEIGDRTEQAHSLRRIGILYDILAQYIQAKEYYERAYSIYEEIGDIEGQGAVLNNLGLLQHVAGDYIAAMKSYEQALQQSRESGDLKLQGTVLINMGALHNDLKQYRRGLERLEGALKIAKEPGMKGLKVEALSQRAIAYLGLGEKAKALDCSSSAVKLLEGGRYLVEAHLIFFNQFRVLAASGSEKEAAVYLEKAYNELMRKASEIKDASMRETFLRGAKVSRQITEEWERIRQRLQSEAPSP